MLAAEHLERARQLLDEAVAEVTAAAEQTEPYALNAMRFLSSELLEIRRRLLNAARALGGARTAPPAA